MHPLTFWSFCTALTVFRHWGHSSAKQWSRAGFSHHDALDHHIIIITMVIIIVSSRSKRSRSLWVITVWCGCSGHWLSFIYGSTSSSSSFCRWPSSALASRNSVCSTDASSSIGSSLFRRRSSSSRSSGMHQHQETRKQSQTADLCQRHVVRQVAAPYSVWQRFPLCPIESNVNENFKVIQNPEFLSDHPSKIESLEVFAIPDISKKFQKDPSITFWVILLTHRQTHKVC